MNKKITYTAEGRKYFLDGEEVTKREFDRECPDKPLGCGPIGHTAGCWPMWSDAMGINPEHIPDATEIYKQLGVPTEFHPETGCVRLTSPAHRKQFAELTGHYDRNGGYGDPQRR